jgi:hypothetical protein
VLSDRLRVAMLATKASINSTEGTGSSAVTGSALALRAGLQPVLSTPRTGRILRERAGTQAQVRWLRPRGHRRWQRGLVTSS